MTPNVRAGQLGRPLPIVGKKQFIEGFTREQLMSASVFDNVSPTRFVFQQGQPQAVKRAYEDAMGLKMDDDYALSDALQYLGNIAFREPVPAYKHSAATFLHLTRRIPSDLTHPNNPRRPAWECQILQDCAGRLGLSG